MEFRVRFIGACVLVAGVLEATAVAIPRITTVEVRRDVTDLGRKGLAIGKDGFWFANFAASKPSVDATPDEHHRNSLPTWMLVDFEPVSDKDSPPYSFSLTPGPDGPDATSTGGIKGYNQLILPDGRAGLSGQLVDKNVGLNGNSTVIKAWEFGPGAPSSTLVHIVLDNAPLSAGTAVDRLRVTHTNAEGGIKDRATFDSLTSTNNGIADVYTFRLDGIEVGSSFAVQLAAAADGSTSSTGLAGIAFDAIKFPPTKAAFELPWWPISLAAVMFLTGFAAGRLVSRLKAAQ